MATTRTSLIRLATTSKWEQQRYHQAATDVAYRTEPAKRSELGAAVFASCQHPVCDVVSSTQLRLTMRLLQSLEALPGVGISLFLSNLSSVCAPLADAWMLLCAFQTVACRQGFDKDGYTK
jgi:hypothetical protein